MRIEELKNYKKILILGFGKEGKSALNFLRHFHPAAEIGIADQKDGPEYLAKQNVYDLVIKTPGIPKRLVNTPYTTAVNIFFANSYGKIIGITGSKGKSTTASLVYAILKEADLPASLVGNIGNPALNELCHGNSPDKIWVYELSSYNLEDIKYSPTICAFLNFFPDHMDYHGGVEEYWKAKKNIAAYAAKEDIFIYNPSYLELEKLAGEQNARLVPFIRELPFSKESVRIPGAHNLDNIRAAVTIADIFNIPARITERAVLNFKGLAHRLENIGTFRGITFYDDANAATPEATLRALEALPNIATLIAGGQDRGYDFSKLAAGILKFGVANLILFPDSGAKIRGAVLREFGRGTSQRPRFYEPADMKEAVRLAYAYTSEKSVCLLSCASPSYSLWKNFEEKGEQFKKFVQEMGAGIKKEKML